MSEKMLELGQGLEIWKVELDELSEQDENANSMTKPMFERLSATIGKDKRLEQLPLCAAVGDKIEIVSGHHRIRAARAGGMSEIFVTVDVTGLTRDQIRAKQLAHNSIRGEDNPELLARIYGRIDDVNARLEAFIDIDTIANKVRDKLKFPSVEFQLDHRVVLITFMPTEQDRFNKAMDAVSRHFGKVDEVWFAQLGGFERVRAAMQKTEKTFDIRAVGTILDKMAEIVTEKIAEIEAAKADDETAAKAVEHIAKTEIETGGEEGQAQGE